MFVDAGRSTFERILDSKIKYIARQSIISSKSDTK